MRLYRGLKSPYRPERVATSRLAGGTNFTDCPALALRYAHGARGVVLVVDVDPEEGGQLPSARLSREFWLVADAQRFMIWGRFDSLLTVVIPAKELRIQLRIRGARTAPDETKAVILRAFIARELRDRQLRSQLAQRSDSAVRPTSHEHGRVSSRER